MDRAGRWELSPAFDVAYAYNPDGIWTARHQMSLAGKRDGFTVEDFRQVGRVATLKRGVAVRILDEIAAVVSEWPRYAAAVGVDEGHIRRIMPALRLKLAPR
jgi:serine/threonine-protein kinase HipA